MPNKRFINALKRIPQKTPPIWFMRQAGRYHSHYQNLKKTHSFEELCKTPSLAAETAMGPIEEFDFDVAILFSDILFPLQSLGMNLSYSPGPIFESHLNIKNLKSLFTIKNPISSLEFQGEAIERTLERLPNDKSLIGFIGGPWTLISYACGLNKSPSPILMDEFKLNILEENILPLLTKNINMQLNAGAEVVMIFDSLAHQLENKDLSLYLKKIFSPLVDNFPNKVGYYAKDGIDYSLIYSAINSNKTPLAGLGIDSNESLKEFFPHMNKGFLQGNFSEELLALPHCEFIDKLEKYLQNIASLSQEETAGWVCGLGHGILKTTPQTNVREFIKRTRSIFS